jgi:hypothetical protein
MKKILLIVMFIIVCTPINVLAIKDDCDDSNICTLDSINKSNNKNIYWYIGIPTIILVGSIYLLKKRKNKK